MKHRFDREKGDERINNWMCYLLFKSLLHKPNQIYGEWSWDRNCHFSWDQKYCKIDHEIEIDIFQEIKFFLQNWSGDRKGPRGSLFQVIFANLT
jgi:hypothetical protein